MATDRRVKVRLEADPKAFVAGMKVAGAALRDLRRDIDTTNDRTAWLAQGFLALGPTLSPLGAAGVGALAGLTTQMLVTGAAAGTLTLAFNGVGDALKALNDYQIDPTDAHLKKLHETMAFIGPTGRDLVRVLDDMRDSMIGLGNLTRDKMFPGVIDGLHELADLGPQVEQIIIRVSSTLGDLSSRAGESLAGPKFAEFFDFLQADAAPILDQMGRTIGNIADGFAAMLVAFAPLSRDFSSGMLEMSRAFADWAHGLRDNNTFQEFVDYIRENSPRVLDLIGQIVDTVVQIGEAAAPVGEVLIPLFTQFLDLIGAIANSPLGPIFITAASAMSIYGRAVALASITTGGLGGKLAKGVLGFKQVEAGANKATAAVSKYGTAAEVAGQKTAKGALLSGRGAARAAGGIGLFALALSPLPEKIGLANEATGALLGLAVGGPVGAAFGALAGGVYDLSKAYVDASNSTREFHGDTEGLAATLDQQTGAITKNTEAFVENELAKQGVIEAAKDIGVSSDMLVDAYLGDELAIYRVNEALGAVNESFYDSEGRTTVSAEKLDSYRQSLELVSSALGGGKSALDEARDGLILIGDPLDDTAVKFKKVAEKVDLFALAIDGLDAKLDARAALRDYQGSIDAVGKALRDNGKTLDVHTQKGRDNQAALDAIASSAKTVAADLEGVERKQFLRQARVDFVQAAIKLGKTREEARKLAKDLGLVDLIHATPTVKVGNLELTQQKVDSLDANLRHLDGVVARPKIILGVFGHARNTGDDFGSGPGFADGGYTGNMPVNRPAGVVHGREFVFSAPATKGNEAALTKLHNQLKGYANGGYVAATAQPAVSYGEGIDYDRLAGAMLNARQMYGDVIVNGDPTVWRKQMEDDHRANSTGKLG